MEAGWKFPVMAGAGSRLCPSLMPAGGLTPTVAVGFGPIAAGIGTPIIPGVGRLSTMPMVSQPASWLGLDAGHDLGTGLGDLALFGHVLRLGAPAAGCLLRCRRRIQVPRRAGRRRV